MPSTSSGSEVGISAGGLSRLRLRGLRCGPGAAALLLISEPIAGVEYRSRAGTGGFGQDEGENYFFVINDESNAPLGHLRRDVRVHLVIQSFSIH